MFYKKKRRGGGGGEGKQERYIYTERNSGRDMCIFLSRGHDLLIRSHDLSSRGHDLNKVLHMSLSGFRINMSKPNRKIFAKVFSLRNFLNLNSSLSKWYRWLIQN